MKKTRISDFTLLFGLVFLAGCCLLPLRAERHALVLQTDFGTKDGAVGAMKGVAAGVDLGLPIFDLSHENTPFDIWQAAYRLKQSAAFWPAGTVFVSVIDPGVGTERRSVVLKTKSGHLFVSPDNGTLSLVAEDLGIEEIRRIDETKHRLPGSQESYTFHGRDVFAYVGAQLASGRISFDEVGPKLEPEIVRLPYLRARQEADALVGSVVTLDFNYGNAWTNIDRSLWGSWKPAAGERFLVTVTKSGETKPAFAGAVPYVHTFGDVPKGEPLLYLNSLLNLSLAINQGDFAATHHIGAGGEWTVRIEKIKP